ncbi:hypothetical protein GQ473_03110 [archaeon]|nr:hypothetical protein [archaeon]
MATITLSMPKRFERAKKEFPYVDWNEVIKTGILKRLEEIKNKDLLDNKNSSDTSS